MGVSGPAPKRTRERAGHRARAELANVLRVPYVVEPPPLPNAEALDPQAVAMYHAMAQSGQAVRYEPSDWVLLQIACTDLSEELRPGGTRSAARFLALMNVLARLGATETDRLRQGLEVERPGVDTGAPLPMTPEQRAAMEKRFAAMAKRGA